MSKLKFNAETPLYTSDERAWPVIDLGEILEELRSDAKPIVLFVHGRGKEPNKSLRGATWSKGLAVHKIERGYSCRVLMLNWNSAFKGLAFWDRTTPLAHTADGAAALGAVLSRLKGWQQSHPQQPRPALLVHSMGSIVVHRAIEAGQWPEASGLFSSVLFSQPDADDVGHASWLEWLAQREATFVTLNRDDHVLLKSSDDRPNGRHALGLGTEEPLAPHARYIDLSNMGSTGDRDDDHEVFGKGAMNGQLHVCQFFTQVLTGQPVVLDSAYNVESVSREVIYRLRTRFEPGHACLQVPELPSLLKED